MTAQRWWVKLAARWLARVDGVTGQLRLAMLALTGVSTSTVALREYGHGEYAWPLIATIAVGTLVYTYLYTEGGVWNQMARDRRDMSDNFAGPSMRMDDTLIAIAVFSAVNNRPPTNEEREMLERAVGEQWHEYRDGIELDE